MSFMQVCKHFRTVIDGTPLLQYIVELGAAGYDPDTTHGASIGESLEKLRRIQKAFRNPCPRLHKRIPLRSSAAIDTRPFTGVYDDFYAWGTSAASVFSENGRTGLNILSLASADMPTEKRFRRLEFDFFIDKYCVDASQDLLVLYSGGLLHFRSFNNGRVHPRVVQRADGTLTTTLGDIPGGSEDLRIEMYGDWLLAGSETASWSSEHAYQYMWHWPTGLTHHLVSYVAAFCWLACSHSL